MFENNDMDETKPKKLKYGIISIVANLAAFAVCYLISIVFELDIYKSVSVFLGTATVILISYTLWSYKKIGNQERLIFVGANLFAIGASLLLFRKAFLGKNYGLLSIFVIMMLMYIPLMIYSHKTKKRKIKTHPQPSADR